MTPFQRHKRRWSNCRRCALCEVRQRVVHARGRLPADILFIGEAPGASEDSIGKPFIGPAGAELDRLIELGIDGQADYCLANLIGCVPKEEGSKIAEPPEESIEKCQPRLAEIVRLCQPKGVILLGRLALKHFKLPDDIPIPVVIDLIHPAAIVRMDVSQQGLARQRCIVALSDLVEEIT